MWLCSFSSMKMRCDLLKPNEGSRCDTHRALNSMCTLGINCPSHACKPETTMCMSPSRPAIDERTHRETLRSLSGPEWREWTDTLVSSATICHTWPTQEKPTSWAQQIPEPHNELMKDTSSFYHILIKVSVFQKQNYNLASFNKYLLRPYCYMIGFF